MKVFLSYSRHDEPAVRSLAENLQRSRVQVWFDEDLGGGDAWWTEILEQIRTCDVFVFALSDHSLNSKPCRAEVDYAAALARPILPVQLGVVTSFRTDPLFSKQYVDYRDPNAATGMTLIAALQEQATQRPELPDPLPEPPPIPYEYLQRLGAGIRSDAELDRSAQAAMVFELRTALEDEDDAGVRADIRELLQLLRNRRDVAYSVVREIDSIIGERGASPEESTPRRHPPPQMDAAGLPASVGQCQEADAHPHQPAVIADASYAPTPAAPTATGYGYTSFTGVPGPTKKESFFKRMSRSTKIVLSACAVVLIVVVAVVVMILDRKFGLFGLSSDETRLLSKLPSGYSSNNCKGHSSNGWGALAGLYCSDNGQPGAPTQVRFWLFKDDESLTRGFHDIAAFQSSGACSQGPGTWAHGQVECNASGLVWTNQEAMIVGDADGSNPALYNWFVQYAAK